ncbi:MAG: LLM class flavin-dependent oxidoreductase, partial [Rhodospirillales bacterium]|nr:LLM class flavin-dependent oxidoreductase [Rhodospirillales bacterium]
GRPVIAQAGGSARGRAFAAANAETIGVHMKGVDQMKGYRDDIRKRMAECGRDPDSCKVLFLVAPILAETDEDAHDRANRRMAAAGQNLDVKLAQLGWSTNIDFSQFDLDQPVGELTTNGHQQSLAQFLRKAGKRTLREAITEYGTLGMSIDLIGSPATVAAKMDEVMQEVGGDGFLFALGNVNRRNVAEITEGLVPELQQRGLTRRAYTKKMLRENLLEF